MKQKLELDGWVQSKEASFLCKDCKWKITENQMVECEQARREFPAARKCFFYEEVTLNE